MGFVAVRGVLGEVLGGSWGDIGGFLGGLGLILNDVGRYSVRLGDRRVALSGFGRSRVQQGATSPGERCNNVPSWSSKGT